MQPYHFGCAEGGTRIFAGLWERWDKGEAPLETLTTIVGPANEQVKPCHDRMPAILDPEDRDLWLDRMRAATRCNRCCGLTRARTPSTP